MKDTPSEKTTLTFKARMALLCGGLLIGLLLAELGLRVVGFSIPSFYTTDLDFGWINRPDDGGCAAVNQELIRRRFRGPIPRAHPLETRTFGATLPSAL